MGAIPRPDMCGERWVNPLPDQKKKTRFAGLFFLTGLRPVLPRGQCPPSKPYTVAPTLQLLTISLAKPFKPRFASGTVFQTPLDRRGQLAEQFYLFIQTPLAIADHFPRKSFSFKHHLTGEAWPACRAILPLHSNTT